MPTCGVMAQELTVPANVRVTQESLHRPLARA
jgi:hypothetical protein